MVPLMGATSSPARRQTVDDGVVEFSIQINGESVRDMEAFSIDTPASKSSPNQRIMHHRRLVVQNRSFTENIIILWGDETSSSFKDVPDR
jgi:hypothetical protein